MTSTHEPDPRTIRVVVLADVRLYREGLTRVLSGQEGLTVVGSGAADLASLERIRGERPDVVLLDATAVCETGIMSALLRALPDARVVAYGIRDDGDQPLRCAEAGVAAFVPGEATGDDLADVIRGSARGEFACSPRVSALLMGRVRALAQGRRDESAEAELTSRERGIVALIADGLSNKEIARELGIELSTVKNHVHHILEKLHVRRRTQAVAYARTHAAGGSARLGRSGS